MQIVIDIPEEVVKAIQNGKDYRYDIHTAIAQGTPLPKGHGDLKDMDNLKYVFDLTIEQPIYSGKDIERAIKSMQTIIEADAESEGKNADSGD